MHSIKSEITIRKILYDIPEVLKVDVMEDVKPFDFSYIPKEGVRQEIENIARSYEPKKTREVGVKMLVLKDNIPVYQKPR